jgi:hypothetical protein
MIFIIILFLTALMLSGVAAYYSVLGLTQIFPGAFVPVMIMGSTLELAKLVTASWLYRNWSVVHWGLRSYFTGAVLVLMLITSMGIFGFLSSAHLQTTTVSSTTTIQIQSLETRERLLQSRMNFILKQAERPDGPTPAESRELRRLQKQLEDIGTTKLPLKQQENTLMGEIGPIRYVAEFLYDKSDPSFVDKAVRIVILLIIAVFDPLAILLLIAANMSWMHRKNFDFDDPSIVQSSVLIPKSNITTFQ